MPARTALALALVAWLVTASSASAEEGLVVVVHPTSRTVELATDDMAAIYLKKKRFWGNGRAIVPLNRDASSSVRTTFTQHVFGDQARRLGVYWNRQYFQGVLPPATLASDEAVKRFVAAEPNAIGYIRASVADRSVKVVLHLD